MSTADDPPPAPARSRRLRFANHLLDLDRGNLARDGIEIPLRPKTFAVLRHLVENAGKLVSKDELFAAVWPDLAVTDDTLVQSIGELRRALADDGAQLIKTVPRRGYRLDAAVSTDAPAAAAHPDSGPAPAPAATFARPRRLARPVIAALAILLVAGLAWIGIVYAPRLPGQNGEGAPPGRIATSRERPAIAVLPFHNQNEDGARDYFADGLTQDVINALGRFSELTVMSWNAVFAFKGKPASPGEIARRLGVRYQLEGGVRQIADRVRVSAQLVDADGRVLWTARFDEALADVFLLQDKLTAQIAGALAIGVAQIEQRRATAKPTESLEAYDYVLRARGAFHRPTRAGIVEARGLLRKATELDPRYAGAVAALAETYYLAPSMGWAESATTFLARAEELATKALSLDPAQVRARVILGRIHIFHHRYEQAAAEMDRAIEINPNDAQALGGRGNILMWLGRTDAAIESLEMAQRLDPEMNTIDRFSLALAYYLKGRYEAAAAHADLGLRENANAQFFGVVLAATYAQLGRSEEAAHIADLVRRRDPTFEPAEFGNKLSSTADREHLRDGLRKAGFDMRPPGAGESAR